MNKAELEKRRAELNAKQTDNEEDFDFILQASTVETEKGKDIVMLPMEVLEEYRDENFESITGRPQPFHAYSREDLEALAKSIDEQGVINPITVRPMENGKYQILAGRNRTRAAALVGKTEMPCIVRKDIDDITAAMIMLDTNLEQRHELSYSEKAYAYKMRVDLQGRQGKRTDLEENAERIDTLSEIGKQNKESRRTVAYLIRLTNLLPELLQMVDSGKIGFKIGVSMSYLKVETQSFILNEIIPLGIKIKAGQIAELRELDECEDLRPETIYNIFKAPEKVSFNSFTISGSKLREYADIFTDTKEIEKLFFEFLNSYRCSKRT